VLTHFAILNTDIDSKLNQENGRDSNGRISTESGLCRPSSKLAAEHHSFCAKYEPVRRSIVLPLLLY
jgi:hypothetical protein